MRISRFFFVHLVLIPFKVRLLVLISFKIRLMNLHGSGFYFCFSEISIIRMEWLFIEIKNRWKIYIWILSRLVRYLAEIECAEVQKHIFKPYSQMTIHDSHWTWNMCHWCKKLQRNEHTENVYSHYAYRC